MAPNILHEIYRHLFRILAALLCNWLEILFFNHSAGAQASPLQCIQLADSCLALGAQSCQHARSVLDELCSSGKLGDYARVIYFSYAHTYCISVGGLSLCYFVTRWWGNPRVMLACPGRKGDICPDWQPVLPSAQCQLRPSHKGSSKCRQPSQRGFPSQPRYQVRESVPTLHAAACQQVASNLFSLSRGNYLSSWHNQAEHSLGFLLKPHNKAHVLGTCHCWLGRLKRNEYNVAACMQLVQAYDRGHTYYHNSFLSLSASLIDFKVCQAKQKQMRNKTAYHRWVEDLSETVCNAYVPFFQALKDASLKSALNNAASKCSVLTGMLGGPLRHKGMCKTVKAVWWWRGWKACGGKQHQFYGQHCRELCNESSCRHVP